MKVVYAKTSTSVTTDRGATMMVLYGQHWPATDPIVARYPELFEDDPRFGLVYSDEKAIVDDVEQATSEPGAGAEQATAAPGERRTSRRG